jgi:wobble nucleotide-excising tRNase
MVMTIAEDMKKLTENIIFSNDVRVKTLGNLAVDTHRTLADARKNVEGFAADRKKMAVEQAKDLAGFVNGLSKNVQSMLKSAQNMVQQFHKENTQISKEQAKNLADFVSGLVSNVGSMLDGFQKDHAHMSKEMKAKLTREIKDIQAEVERILGDADKLMGEFSADMAGVKKAWQGMSAVLARSRKSGFVKAGVKVSTVSQGRKKNAKKSKSSRQKVGAGV